MKNLRDKKKEASKRLRKKKIEQQERGREGKRLKVNAKYIMYVV